MQAEVIAPFGEHIVGDVVEVPDGSEVSPLYFRVLEPAPSAAEVPDDSGLPVSA